MGDGDRVDWVVCDVLVNALVLFIFDDWTWE